MTTESSITSEMMAALRQESRKAVILKHADRFTFAIPDISVTYKGVTQWLEVKYVRRSYRELLGERNIYVQIAMIGKLGRQGVGWFVVFYGDPVQYTDVLTAEQLKARMDGVDGATDRYVDRRQGKKFAGVCAIVFGGQDELHSHGPRVPPEDGDPDPTDSTGTT